MNRLLLAAAAALPLAACAPEFDPASQVDGLRVLAIRADPPEIAPAPAGGGPAEAPDRAALTSLVLRPATVDPARETTILYLACTPVPGDPTPSPCVVLASLRDPTEVLAWSAQESCDAEPPAGGAPPPVAFAGAEVCDGTGAGCVPAVLPGDVALPTPELALPAGYGFDALPPGAPERILGVEAAVLAFAIDATVEELAEGADPACPLASVATRLDELWDVREHVVSVKRVQIRGPESPNLPNRNPVIDGIAADGLSLRADAPETLAPGTLALTPVLPDGADALVDRYTELTTTGEPLGAEQDEEWVYSWFSTAGELDALHTRGLEADEWVVAGGTARVAVVVRDLRGGVQWAVREVALAP